MNEISDSRRFELLFRIGLLLTLMVGYGIYSNFDNLKWYFIDWKTYHQTIGHIVSSNVEGQGIHGGWRFYITYNYKVGNQEFLSNRVHFGYQAMANPSYAESYVEKYPAGKQVTVFYAENNPQNSVLEPDVKWNGLLEMYLLLMLVPIAIFGLAGYFFNKSRQQNSTVIHANH